MLCKHTIVMDDRMCAEHFIVWKQSFLYDKKPATWQFPVRWQFSIGTVFTADRKCSIISFRSSLLQVQSCPSRKLFSVVRNNAALIVLVDEVFDLIRFQNLYQCLYTFVVLVAFLNCNHVYILLDCSESADSRATASALVRPASIA